MPRKTSQAAKKDTAVDAKSDGGAPRRSGRAVSKPESSSAKEATRSRRSSTAAQTAASVADSRTPRGRSTSSRRESTSPSDNRGKPGSETTAVRVKSARRSTGRINYKESDGEEEVAAPKYDENFDSPADEFEESDEDEKSKPKEKTKPQKSPAKTRAAKDKPKTPTHGRKGKQARKKSNEDEDSETLEVSDNSAETENAPVSKRNKTAPVKEKEIPKSSRSRKQKVDVQEVKTKAVAESKVKPSRRSARSVSNKEENKEETSKRRTSRSLQAKRYTEDEEDDDIEEISEPKVDDSEEYVKADAEGSRKRKRGATTETSKRLKETSPSENEPSEANDVEKNDADDNDEIIELKVDKENEDAKKDLSDDEAMEIDESDSVEVLENDEKSTAVKNETTEPEKEATSTNKESLDEEKDKEGDLHSSAKEKLSVSSKQESVDSSENLDESMHSSDSEHESRADHSASSGLEDSQDAKESMKEEKKVSDNKLPLEASVKQKQEEPDLASQSSESIQEIDENSEESKKMQPASVKAEQNVKKSPEKCESNIDFKSASENFKNESPTLQEKEISAPVTSAVTTNIPSESSVPSPVTHSREPNQDSSVNGSEVNEAVPIPTQVIHNAANVIEPPEDTAPKANGAHNDLHNNSASPTDQYYLPTGRKYVVNPKMSENARQSLKTQTFGFVSYNLGSTSSEASLQKDKLLKELNNLNAHIICLQQVAKPFYNAVLEPSLDALGFKGTFSQPEDSLKGMATFYKSSLFRLGGRWESSLKQLIDKELEASTLDYSDRIAVRTHIKRCGSILFTQLTSVIGTHSVTVANVLIPPTELGVHALQVSCMAQEIIKLNEGKPLLLGGEFNMTENEASYQLLRDGYLSNDMIEELQRRKDVAIPGKENAALLNLLWKSFQHPSSNLCSCYSSVLDHELFIPELKTTSPDLLWYSSDSLHTVGILDIISDKLGDRHVSLKADMAFPV